MTRASLASSSSITNLLFQYHLFFAVLSLSIFFFLASFHHSESTDASSPSSQGPSKLDAILHHHSIPYVRFVVQLGFL